jgi:hypothetical protein
LMIDRPLFGLAKFAIEHGLFFVAKMHQGNPCFDRCSGLKATLLDQHSPSVK